MTKEEILHLGELSRIRIPEAEADQFYQEIESIIDYVGQVSKLVEDGELLKAPGPVYNVFREDEVTNTPGEYTEDLVAAFPEKSKNYLKVKKILNPDS